MPKQLCSAIPVAPRVCGIRAFGLHSSVFKGAPAKPCKLWGSGCAMKKSQKGAWPQKPVFPAKAARACFRRFFAAHTPSPEPAHQVRASPKPKTHPTSSPAAKSQATTLAHNPPILAKAYPPNPSTSFSQRTPNLQACTETLTSYGRCTHRVRAAAGLTCCVAPTPPLRSLEPSIYPRSVLTPYLA